MNKIHIKVISVVFITAVVALFFSCRKNPTPPPIKPFATGPAITIQELRTLNASNGGQTILFTSNTILTAVVTADESSGQLYKEVYVRDNSGTFATTNHYGAISLHFLHGTSGFLCQGDSVAFNLNGTTLDLSSGGSLEIDSLNNLTCANKLKSGLNPQPLIVTIPQLTTFSGGQFIYDAQLVQLNNVEFIAPNVGTTYAIPSSSTVNISSSPPVNINKYVCDATGNTIVAYNSGYANFAGSNIPNNSGTITAIANLYTTMQLSIRSYQDANLTANYIPTVYDTITQHFTYTGLSNKSSCANMAGWKTFDLQGNLFWEGAEYGNYPNWKYAPVASNYQTQTPRNDLWLVSPPIKDANYWYATGSYSKKIDFSSAIGYATPTNLLSVWVSNTFDGTHIIPSEWTNISNSNAYLNNINQSTAPANFQYAHGTMYGSKFSPAPVPVLVGSGNSPYFYLAFRYQSNTHYADSSGSSYYLGTLLLKNN